MISATLSTYSLSTASTSLEPRDARTAMVVQHSSQRQVQISQQLGLEEGVKVDAFAVFERALAMGYEKLQAQFQVPGFEPEAVEGVSEGLTAEKVSSNILGFIERRLMMDQAEGATVEELQSRLDAGLKGFKQGFGEAKEQLEALSMLNEAVEQDIGKTYDLVLEGIEKLHSQYVLGEDPEASPSAEETAAAASAPQAVNSLSSANYDYAEANTFRFTLETADGDKVSITAEAAQAFSASYQLSSTINGDGDSEAGEKSSAAQFNVNYANASHFNLTVEGELDEEELKAINELLGQVNDLSANFFAGDVDKAFEEALGLGYDSSEITAFSLNLSHVEVQRVSAAYEEFKPTESREIVPLADKLKPVGDFAQHLQEALATASLFVEPLLLLMEISEKLAQQQLERNQYSQTLQDEQKLQAQGLVEKTEALAVEEGQQKAETLPVTEARTSEPSVSEGSHKDNGHHFGNDKPDNHESRGEPQLKAELQSEKELQPQQAKQGGPHSVEDVKRFHDFMGMMLSELDSHGKD